MTKSNTILSIFFHNYYGDDSKWINSFFTESPFPFNLFYNCVYNSFHRSREQLDAVSKVYGDGLFLRESPNKGKDIGGKLLLMDSYLRLGIKAEYILLAHDKKSPSHIKGDDWNKTLFRIAKKENLDKIASMFNKRPEIGIIASKNAIRNEEDNDQGSDYYTSSKLIRSLKNKYSIQPPALQYVAGTMFCVRAGLYEDFFNSYAPLLVRSTLENGNITDENGATVTHSWERLLSWIVTSKGYKIEGI